MTRTLGDSDVRESPRVIGLTLLTLAVATGSSFLMHKLGFAWALDAMHRAPFWQGLAFSAALWSAIILLLLNAPRLARAVKEAFRQAPAAMLAFARIALSAGRLAARAAAWAIAPLTFVFAVLARMTEPFRMGLMLMALPLLAALMPALQPLRKLWCGVLALAAALETLRGLWRGAVSPAIACAARRWQALRIEWTLWRAYRAEFRGVYASYSEFKRAFNARMNSEEKDSRQDDPPPPARDPFASACAVMGLPADGSFTEREFKARYRALMKEAHPDMGGSQERAAQINAASLEIKTRKGW